MKIIFLVVLAIFFARNETLCAQTAETFDGLSTSWKINTDDVDCEIENGSWQQSRIQNDLAESYEQIEFTAGKGESLILHHAITPAFVIPELKASLRVFSKREGVQLSARIVLPHSIRPDGTPITVVVDGPRSRRREVWETLEFDSDESLHTLLASKLWFLRSKYHREVTLRDAYVDQLRLNVYCGRGETHVRVDDLEISGVVEAERIARKFLSESTAQRIGSRIDSSTTVKQATATSADSLVVRDGTVVLVNKKPFFPRIVQHNGESFDYLKAIGFNTVELKSNATADQLKEAKKANIWLIAPPPASVGVEPIGFEYDPVLAWSVGRNLTGRNESQIRQLIREIRETDTRKGRPIFGNSISHWSKIAQQLDIHSIGLEPVGSSYLLSQYSDWLEVRSKSVGSSMPICADVQTEMNEAVLAQTSAIFGSSPPTPLEFQQVKSIAAEAITAGARCLRFRSRSRLDGNDPESRLRSLTLQYVNRWLSQIEHWVAGGVVLGKLQNARDMGALDVTALATNRARLLLVQRPTHHEQFWAGDSPIQPITVFDTDTIHTGRVYRLTDSELAPLSTRRTPEGTAITIEQSPFMSTLVMTQDSSLINELTRKINQDGQQSMFDMHLSITQQWLAIEQLLASQMTQLSKASGESSGAINEAVTALQNVRQLSQQKSYAQAQPFLDKADERLAFFRRELQATALGTFQSKTSSALTMHSALVPLHWVLANQIPRSEKGINNLAAGDFEDLNLMKRSGWSNSRIEDHRLRTHVELSTEAAKDGATGLKMSVNGSLSLVESVPLWVGSPPIRIKPRQLVRVHGWVKVLKPIVGSEAGFRIVDSLGGQSMAENVIRTEGWQEFAIYRCADEDSQFRVKFELTGIGEAMVDEVTIQVIDLPAPSRSAKR